MPPKPRPLRLAYFGDDFTGSTDALESLARAGLRTILFISPPTPAQLARYPHLDAVGVAGLTRSLAPAPMAAELRPAFTALRALGATHVHYKVCSTFDSSPTIGSIGRAIEVGTEIFRGPFVPLLVGAPALGRYCVFGNLFARFGIGSGGAIHRLDRHPAMSRHPVTPADESDLRLHLARQTNKRIGLFDLLQLERPETQARAALDDLVADGAEIVLFDVLYSEQLERLGALIDHYGSSAQPLFSVGSSAIEAALAAYWAKSGEARPSPTFPHPGPARPLLVVSGSCSPVTERQIAWARDHGFYEVMLDVAAGISDGCIEAAIAAVDEHLRSDRHVVVHTNGSGKVGRLVPAPAQTVGSALGRLARTCVQSAGVRRLLIAGGDTSSYAARALGIEAVEMIAPLAPGAPLCRAHAPGSPADGLEINFKGGQVGTDDYFGIVAEGGSDSPRAAS